ncbi:hypothetical protein J4206_03095 [Candidatus Woesearchaeota archaeon]|nr:hypothetical protein [Candidatus Woesearchaeota archaeon]
MDEMFSKLERLAREIPNKEEHATSVQFHVYSRDYAKLFERLHAYFGEPAARIGEETPAELLEILEKVDDLVRIDTQLLYAKRISGNAYQFAVVNFIQGGTGTFVVFYNLPSNYGGKMLENPSNAASELLRAGHVRKNALVESMLERGRYLPQQLAGLIPAPLIANG